MCRLNNMLLNNQWITENQRINQKIRGDKWKWKHNNPKSKQCSKSSSKREVYSDTSLPLRKQEKSQINSLNLHPKEVEKEHTKPKVSRRKKIIKIRTKFLKRETKKTIEKINKTKSWLFEKIDKIDKL